MMNRSKAWDLTMDHQWSTNQLGWVFQKDHISQMTFCQIKIRLETRSPMRPSIPSLRSTRDRCAERTCQCKELVGLIIWNGSMIKTNGEILSKQMKHWRRASHLFMEWICRHLRRSWRIKNIRALKTSMGLRINIWRIYQLGELHHRVLRECVLFVVIIIRRVNKSASLPAPTTST